MIAAQECVLEMLQLTGNKLREYLPTDEEQISMGRYLRSMRQWLRKWKENIKDIWNLSKLVFIHIKYHQLKIGSIFCYLIKKNSILEYVALS